MNSMIRQHHLRIPDVKAFLRTFERTKPLSPDDWASKESRLYEPGYLIFCLEPVAAPAGLSSFSKRGEEQGETFRVQNLCVVISKEEDNKCVAVNVSPSAYEFRVLDTLLLEKAMKAILDGRDFNYLAARPIQKLSPDDIKALYKLGSEYAKGGSRRALAVEGATLAEPAVALLNQLGAKVATQVGKQLVDIGSICHMIFTPDGRQEDKSKSLLKSCFVPVRGDDESAAAAAPQSQSFGEQPLYSIDPMADAARLADNYSSEAGNIDLSALAPEPLQSANLGAQGQPFAEAPSEPSSSFGDFGMGLLSALAPQQPANPPQAMSFESLNEGGRPPELPSLPFGSVMPTNANAAPNSMDTLPPSSPGANFSGMAAAGMSSMDNPPMGNTASHTGLPSFQTQTPSDAPPAAPHSIAPAAPQSMAAAANPGASQTGMPGLQPRSSAGNGQAHGTAAEWFIMSHEAIPSQATMPTAEQPSASSVPAQAQPLPPQAEPAAPAAPKEDFSQQFLNDWQQGHAGSAAVSAAEQELENERKLKAERERGKEQRLRNYFGEEHFQKYVKGEISEPDMDKVDSWQLDPSQYKSEPAQEGPNFDSDIFANAARSTLETNPEAIVLEPPREEITGPPPDPSWSIPAILAPEPPKTKMPSFDSMLSAGGELPVPEKIRPLEEPQAETAPGEVPNLSILDALHKQELDKTKSTASELPPLHLPEDSPASANSLFARLTGELSQPVENASPAASTSQSNLPAMPAESPVAPTIAPTPPPVTINWAPPVESSGIVSSGDMWPIPPSESLFAAPEEAPQPTLAQAPMPTQNPTPAHTAPAQDFATQGSAPSTAEAGASPAITGGADSWQTAASADQAGQQFAAPAAQFAAPTPVVPAAVNESSSTQISEVGGTAVNDALADALDAAIDAAVGTRSEDSLDAILDSSTARSNAIAQNWAAEAEAVLNESLQQPELTAPAQLQPEMTASVSEATAETSTETGSETGSETAAEKAIEQSSESTESGGHTDVQQPRVRPRDYSSPLRAPKALSAADSITPMTPHQTVNRQNAPTPLQSSPMPTAAYENETAAGTASGSSSTSIPTVSPTGHAVTPTPVPVAQAPAQPLAPEPVQAKATPAPIAPPAAAETTEAATPEITTSVSAATPAQANYTPSAEETAPQATLPSAKTESPAPAETPAAAKPLPFRPKPAAAVGRASSDAHPAVAPPAAASGAQDTRLMMNEMASLMSKLEMQVAKAANKMASRSEELRSRLSQQVDIVVKEAQDVERQAEINLATLASEFKTKLDGLSTEVQNSLAKDGQNAQLTVQEIAQNGWEKLESEQKALSAEITHSAQDFRLELDRLTNTVNSRLDRLIESRNKELIALSDSILLQLKESYDAYNIKVSQRFDRFEQRMDEETSSISGSLERNMRSMVDEIETSLERACEKLKNTKFELEQTVAHTIAVAETSIAQKAKHVLTETLLPRLNEQKEIIRTMIADMAKQVSSESNVGLDLELAKLDQGRARASQNLKKIADECVDELEMMGRSIKSGLEDHFKRVSSDLMVRTREVGDRIRETERRMADSEYALKGLAESSTVDSEPELAEERNHAISKLASLKLEASKVLASTIEQNLDNLDSKGEQLSTELSNKRSELTTHVRESAETNISKIRQALQEATSSIQSAREKYME